MARSRDYKYELKLARQRVKKSQFRLRKMQEFMTTWESRVEMLENQLDSLKRHGEEYDVEIPHEEIYLKKQRRKIMALEKILKKDREIVNLQREVRRLK